MTSLSHNPEHRTTASLTSELDVIAAAVHMLGYWPQNSMVILTVDGRGVGPVLRVDLADPDDIDLHEYLATFLQAIPQESPMGLPIQRVFVLLFSAESEPPNPSTTSDTERETALDTERAFVEIAQSYLHSLVREVAHQGLGLLDLIAVGHRKLWCLTPSGEALEFSGYTAQVLSSPVYLHLVATGSVVATSFDDHADEQGSLLQDTVDEQKRDAWILRVETSARTIQEEKETLNPNEYFQLDAELAVWNIILNRVTTYLETRNCSLAEVAIGDPIRAELDPELAGYLVASLNSTATLNLLVYLAETTYRDAEKVLRAINASGYEVLQSAGQVPQRVLPSSSALQQIGLGHLVEQTQPPVPEKQDFDGVGESFAHLLCGTGSEPPHWLRLEALECLAWVLEPASTGKPAALLLAILSWAKWLRGRSTEAHYLLEQADPRVFERSPIMLHSLLDSGSFPAWVSQPGGVPSYTVTKNSSPIHRAS
ncbi:MULTISPECIES: DUF4192 family protein [Rothia]|uniref:DUF4192 family protein n=1 Tax=Rothia nasimurium TaxID=85336 RepID=A0A1Y1RPQ6_9MICC|nr:MULTISPECIES: DUF4192 family protein [Rothia]ORC18864.1 hypothetical protein A7979_02375 [Rothia nasimurium]